VFNCGYCVPGKPHYCRTCGAYNHHRSQDCLGKPHRDAILANAPAPRAPANAPANAPAAPHANAPAYAPTPAAAPAYAPTPAAAPAAPHANAPSAAAIIVIWNDKILIQKRAGWLGGKYATPGGAIDPLETAEGAALRELNEEAGLVLDSTNMKQLGSIHPPNRNPCKTIIVKYIGGSNPIFGYASAAHECDQIPFSILGDHACHGHKWMTKDQIETLINKNMFLGPALPAIREAFKLIKKP
jgi:8-oxo-dGTP pyrophosphatase MutT (NUDIX family)